MAKEWYLMNTGNDTISGFESDDFNQFATDTFEESLFSSMGREVLVFSSDLSRYKKKRVIIQGNIQDTKLKAMQRTMLAPIGSCKAGQYVYYKSRYWLIVGLVDDNGIYEKAVLILCNHLLTWKNKNGDIIQRWVNVSSASQYNNGETSNKFYFVRSDQLMILTPDDPECLLIEHKHRFIIDKKCKIYEKEFSKNTTFDNSNSVVVYELTRMDNVIYDYQDSGHSEFMAYQCEQRENDGYCKINGNGYWLCDIPQDDNKNIISSCDIECDEPIIYCGLEPSIFTARFSSNNDETIVPNWEIKSEFVDKLNIEYIGNSISISVDDNKLINKSFELSLYADENTKTSIIVNIKAFL